MCTTPHPTRHGIDPSNISRDCYTLSWTNSKSLHKIDLLGKYVNPAFLALSGFVLGVNTIAGGSLVVVSVLVNGIFLAIAGGIAYLGHLVSEKERQKMGGPGGPKTKEIAQMLELLGRAVA